MKTIQEITDWLKTSNHVKTVLVEVTGVIVEGSPTTLYMSSSPYATRATDTPSNTNYLPTIESGISFREDVSIDKSPNLGFGDISINNSSGDTFGWLNYIWTNRPINIYIGDPTWPREDFLLIFTGLVDSVSAKSSDSINIIIVDKLKKLDVPVDGGLLGGITNNKDKNIPITLGECFNVEPLLVSPAFHTYKVHNAAIEDVIEVRDNGAPVLFTKDLLNGTFTLTRSPFGKITASVQGAVVTALPADVVQHVLTSLGPTTSIVPVGDIDTSSFTAHNTSAPYPVGYYITSSKNKVKICQEILESCGSSLVCDNYGKFKIVRIDLNNITPQLIITEEDMYKDSLNIGESFNIRGAVKLGYNKNWAPNDNLAQGIVSSTVDYFKNDWQTVTVSDQAVLDTYMLSDPVDQEDTYLLRKVDAEAEADRRISIWSQQRYVFTFSGLPHLLLTQLGTPVSIVSKMFGMENGKSGIVVSINRDWIAGRINIGVLI